MLTLAQADNRLILFDQSDFGAKRGWYVAFENQGPEGTPLPIDTLRLILAIGDGQAWHFAETKGFQIGQSLDVGARIGPDGATLSVDGKEVGRIAARLAPQKALVVVGRYPDWASAPTTYRITRKNYTLGLRGGAKTTPKGEGFPNTGSSAWSGEFPKSDLEAFERPLEMTLPFPSLTDIDASFEVSVTPPATLGTDVVDAYGQVVGANVPKRIRSEADLETAIADEAKRAHGWTRDPSLDPYGGLTTAPWHERPTGFYRVVKHANRWTMVSPQGNPLFYTGLCTAPAPLWDVTPTTGRESIFAALPPKGELWKRGVWGDDADYFTPIGWSLQRKYGEGWQEKAKASMRARLAQWGFSGMGKWAEPVPGVPRIVDLSADWPKLVRHLDPFDPKACEAARESLARQLKDVKADPWTVGTAIGNEYDETVTLDEIDKLKKGPDSPAKAALMGLDPETARHRYAAAYYKFLYDAVKAIDPNHLYLGYWVVPGWWQNESDWDLIAPYCDVVGYDRYSDAYAGMETRQKRTDKPTLLGEFSFPAWYGGTRGYGRYSVYTETDADSGRKYAETVAAAAKDPYCVGALWFQYRDEPVTGRGPGKGPQATQGEHYAFGFVDVNDRPKWDLVAPARKANEEATKRKLGG